MIRRIFSSASLIFALGACGEGPSASLALPEVREARVHLTPALDLSGLDPELARRVSIDEIVVNLHDLRLLGTHPQFPVGGFPLIGSDRQLVAGGGNAEPATFPFPENWTEDDLAVFAELKTSEELDGASVLIQGRFFAAPPSKAQNAIQSDTRDPGPDGEPADPGPDGEPAKDCYQCPAQSGHALETDAPSIAFELRGSDEVDLVVDLDQRSRLDVVLGVPAQRWLTPAVLRELVTRLEQQKTARPAQESAQAHQLVFSEGGRRGGSREPKPETRTELSESRGSEYRLLDGRHADPNRYRR